MISPVFYYRYLRHYKIIVVCGIFLKTESKTNFAVEIMTNRGDEVWGGVEMSSVCFVVPINCIFVIESLLESNGVAREQERL